MERTGGKTSLSTPPLQALVFDVDGTLADTEEMHRRAFNAAFREAGPGWHWSPQLYRELLSVSGGRERIEYYATRVGHAHADATELRCFARALHAMKTARYGRFLGHVRVPLRPGVWRLLSEARRSGLRLAIATSTARSNVNGVLDPSLPGGCAAWFDVIVTADEVEPKKPSPAVYQLALAQLGLSAEACLAFEDTPNGNRAALAAGIDTIITTHAYTAGQDFRGALIVLDSLGEPGHPSVAASGDLAGAQFVNIELLRRLHDRGQSRNVRQRAQGSKRHRLAQTEARLLPSNS